MTPSENQHEAVLIEKLRSLSYDYRPDITDRATLERNFREKFEALNRVRLTDAEFARLLAEIVVADDFTASKTLRGINSFTRDHGMPLNYSLVNLKDWCKNHFDVINQLRINTDNSHHRAAPSSPSRPTRKAWCSSFSHPRRRRWDENFNHVRIRSSKTLRIRLQFCCLTHAFPVPSRLPVHPRLRLVARQVCRGR